MKKAVLWVITLFGSERAATSATFLLGLLFDPEDRRHIFL
jgi:hypothetical protein